MSSRAFMSPHIGLTDEEHHPWAYEKNDEIVPENRASALRSLLMNQTTYPHCPRCHRALMADGSCPSKDFALETSIEPGMNWWAELKLRFAKTRA